MQLNDLLIFYRQIMTRFFLNQTYKNSLAIKKGYLMRNLHKKAGDECLSNIGIIVL